MSSNSDWASLQDSRGGKFVKKKKKNVKNSGLFSVHVCLMEMEDSSVKWNTPTAEQ